MTAQDYSKLYCPRCLKPLPANGSHWDSCREYEADDAGPDELPLIKLEAYRKRVEQLDMAIAFSKAKLRVQQEKRDKAQAKLEKLIQGSY